MTLSSWVSYVMVPSLPATSAIVYSYVLPMSSCVSLISSNSTGAVPSHGFAELLPSESVTVFVSSTSPLDFSCSFLPPASLSWNV